MKEVRVADLKARLSDHLRYVRRGPFDDPRHPARPGFPSLRERAGRLYFTLGNQESDVWVAEVRGAAR